MNPVSYWRGFLLLIGPSTLIAQTGAVLYASLLAWNSSRLLANMATRYGDPTLAAEMQARAAKLQVSVNAKLWDPTRGVYLASTGIDKANIDVWGNAMAVAMGFTSAEQGRSIFGFFRAHEADIFHEGQVRYRGRDLGVGFSCRRCGCCVGKREGGGRGGSERPPMPLLTRGTSKPVSAHLTTARRCEPALSPAAWRYVPMVGCDRSARSQSGSSGSKLVS